MRDAATTTKAGVQPLDLGELTIIMLYDYQYCEYWGTRAQLEAEGVIPDDFEWPEGFNSAYWQSGPFDFWLRRERPEGAKGPRRDFVDYDYWRVRWDRTKRRPCILMQGALKLFDNSNQQGTRDSTL